jgi:hypothetical protein
MTANVTIEIARRNNVLRAPAAALRFRPTTDIFAALKQEVPPELQRGGRGGRGGQGRGEGRADQGQGGQPTAQNAPAQGQPQATPPQQQGQRQQGPERPATAQGGGDRGGDRPAGEGRRGFGDMTPEQREARRKQMEERLKNMSPEERERYEARRREGGGRGFGPGGQATEGGGRGGAQAQQSGRRNQPGSTSTSPTSPANAPTIDALFAPLPPTENRGRLWMYVNKQLKSVAVRTGITDGTWTEIIGLEGGEGGELEAGAEVVTTVVTGLEQAQRPGQQGPGGSPLMPQGRGGPGGFGGGRGR